MEHFQIHAVLSSSFQAAIVFHNVCISSMKINLQTLESCFSYVIHEHRYQPGKVPKIVKQQSSLVMLYVISAFHVEDRV